jgi:peroxiredoxin
MHRDSIPRPATRFGPCLTLVLSLATSGCGGGRETAAPAVGPAEGAAHPMVGRRAPEFAAQDPTGAWLPSRNFKDKPLALLFFRPGAPFAADLAREFGRLRSDSSFAPIVFLGLGRGSLDQVKQFIQTQNVTLPVLRDPETIGRSFGVGDLPTVILLDAAGNVRFRLDGYLGRQFRPRLEATVAALQALPQATDEKAGALDLAYTPDPRAPLFAARDLDGRRVDLAKLKGRVVVVTFFDQNCPHCDRDLPGLVPALKEFRARGVAVVGIVTREGEGTLRPFLKKHGIDYPVIVDGARAIFAKYESTRTPDTFLIDRDGFIRFREQGDRPDRGDLTRLQLRLLLGEDPGRLAASLPRGRYVGDGACRACHLVQYRDWLLTPHSIAWDSLQKGDKWRDPECVPCHVTAKDRPGGYVDHEKTSHMLSVQCEVCHGEGGGHPSGIRADFETMSGTCAACHTGKFVLNFDLGEAMVLMAHREQPDLDRLFRYSTMQRERLEQINKRRLETFRSGVAYVGADACRDCHRAEYDQWARTPHAAAFTPLLRADRGADTTCTPCHTTGAGHKGGFGDKDGSGGAMIHVQCEVCHGPGADHVGARPELKKETIYGITDQCSFCIIQGVCATCHDQANDPDFDIEAALPRVQH